MADFAVIGALALDRPVRLGAPLVPGARVAGTSLGGVLAGRLGGGGANAGERFQVALRCHASCLRTPRASSLAATLHRPGVAHLGR